MTPPRPSNPSPTPKKGRTPLRRPTQQQTMLINPSLGWQLNGKNQKKPTQPHVRGSLYSTVSVPKCSIIFLDVWNERGYGSRHREIQAAPRANWRLFRPPAPGLSGQATPRPSPSCRPGSRPVPGMDTARRIRATSAPGAPRPIAVPIAGPGATSRRQPIRRS